MLFLSLSAIIIIVMYPFFRQARSEVTWVYSWAAAFSRFASLLNSSSVFWQQDGVLARQTFLQPSCMNCVPVFQTACVHFVCTSILIDSMNINSQLITVPLSTQVYKWVPANLMLGVTLRWTSIPSRGGVEILLVASCY